MKKDTIIVLFLFVAIIILALWISTTPGFVPYSSTIASGPAKYEGFTSSLEYSSTKDNSAIDGVSMNNSINNTSSTTNCKSVSGYSGYGVFCNPSYVHENIDIYSQANGQLNGESYGYYNSRGPIQMDDNMKKMLLTRGMNASGEPSSVGGSPV